MAYEWNPDDKSVGITLSNGDLTAFRNSLDGAGNRGVRSVGSKTSGKWYFEVHIDGKGSIGPSFGWMDADHIFTQRVGADSAAVGVGLLTTLGRVYHDGVYINTDLGTFVAGDYGMVAVDFSTGDFWFGRNGTWHNGGDPATGTNPTYTEDEAIGATLYPAAVLYNVGTDQVTLRLHESAFEWSLPSGFSALESGPRDPITFEPNIASDSIGLAETADGHRTLANVNIVAGFGFGESYGNNYGLIEAGIGFSEIPGRERTVHIGTLSKIDLNGQAGGLKASVSDVASFITLGLQMTAETLKSISPPAKGRIRFNDTTGAFLAVVKSSGADGGAIGFSTDCDAFKANVIYADAETNLGLTGVPTRINDLFEPGVSIGIGLTMITSRELEKYAGVSSVLGFGDLLEVLKIRNPSIAIENMGIRGQCGGLNYSAWLKQNRDLVVYRYYARITGVADGLADYALTGFKSFQFRMKSDSASYLDIVLVYNDAMMAAVADRPNGDLVIDMVATVNGAESLREELIRAPFYSTRYDKGGENRSIIIIGYASGISGGSRVELENVTMERMLADGRLQFRCARPDFYLKPGDTAVYGGHEITVGSVSSAISPISQYMDVSE